MSNNDVLKWLEKIPNLMIINEAGVTRIGALVGEKAGVKREWFSGDGLPGALTNLVSTLDVTG